MNKLTTVLVSIIALTTLGCTEDELEKRSTTISLPDSGADTNQPDDAEPPEFSHEEWATGTWQRSEAGPQLNANQDDLYCHDADSCVVGNSAGQIWVTDDGGEHWTKTLDQPGTFFRAMSFFNRDIGIAANIGPGAFPGVSDTTIFYRTSDGGQTWAPVETETEAPGICNLHTVDSETMWASGRVLGPGWVARTSDTGVSWQWLDISTELDWVIDIEMADSETGLVIGQKANRGRVIRTTDGGSSWTVVWESDRFQELPWKIAFPSANVGYIGVQNPSSSGTTRILKTQDGGESWSAMDALPMPYRAKGLGFATEEVGWLAGESQAYMTQDGGESWHEVEGLSAGVNRFRFPAPGVAWAIGTSVWKMDIR